MIDWPGFVVPAQDTTAGQLAAPRPMRQPYTRAACPTIRDPTTYASLVDLLDDAAIPLR